MMINEEELGKAIGPLITEEIYDDGPLYINDTDRISHCMKGKTGWYLILEEEKDTKLILIRFEEKDVL